jgi:hypothetical protein
VCRYNLRSHGFPDRQVRRGCAHVPASKRRIILLISLQAHGLLYGSLAKETPIVRLNQEYEAAGIRHAFAQCTPCQCGL